MAENILDIANAENALEITNFEPADNMLFMDQWAVSSVYFHDLASLLSNYHKWFVPDYR